MNAHITFLASLFLATVTAAAESPRHFFDSKEELLRSAKEAFAGGSTQELEVAGKRVIVSYTFGSGLYSSDAAIYVEMPSGWSLVAYHARFLGDVIEAIAEDDQVVLRTQEKKLRLMSVSLNPKE